MSVPTPSEIEAAVRAVLEEIFRREAEATARPDAPEVFAGRLLTLKHVEALPPGTSEIRLAPTTVITPLARDQLKRQGTQVRIVSSGELARTGLLGEWGYVIENALPIAGPLRRELASERETWFDVGDDVRDAASWVAEAPHRGAVVVTVEASVATWRACQVPGTRAATIHDAEAVARASRHLGVNLLVVEPGGQSIFTLKQLFATFRRGGAPIAPSEIGEETAHADRRGDRTSHALAPEPSAEARQLPHRPADASGGFDGRLPAPW